MILQLNPPIPLITPKRKGFAHLVIDYSQEHDLIWVVFLDDSGECWSYSNKEVKIVYNETLRRAKKNLQYSLSDFSEDARKALSQ
jgi:hypothetical protein